MEHLQQNNLRLRQVDQAQQTNHPEETHHPQKYQTEETNYPQEAYRLRQQDTLRQSGQSNSPL